MDDLSICEEENSLLGLQASTFQQLLHVIPPFISPIPVAAHMADSLLWLWLWTHAMKLCLEHVQSERANMHGCKYVDDRMIRVRMLKHWDQLQQSILATSA